MNYLPRFERLFNQIGLNFEFCWRFLERTCLLLVRISSCNFWTKNLGISILVTCSSYFASCLKMFETFWGTLQGILFATLRNSRSTSATSQVQTLGALTWCLVWASWEILCESWAILQRPGSNFIGEFEELTVHKRLKFYFIIIIILGSCLNYFGDCLTKLSNFF